MLSELDDAGIDLVTSHAAGRFKWIDIRSTTEWNDNPPRKPVNPPIVHIPLDELATRVRAELPLDLHLVVYGSDDAETEAAVADAGEGGYQHILAFRGGFEALVRANLA